MTDKNHGAVPDFQRRSLLRYSIKAGLMLPFFDVSSTAALASTSSTVVNTEYGKVQGYRQNGLNIYKGIPYGADTSGDQRFLPPQPPVNWRGIREAVHLGPPSPHRHNYQACYRDVTPYSEDCLVLNVWSPVEATKPAPLPVMVWIHGGGFETESAGSPMYQLPNLAKHGNVVGVSINHRLNAFGYMYQADLSDDERFNQTGNLGHLDLIAALQWIQRNIEQFGGDPDNVTLFGESGGGAKISTLMAMPQANNLYHKTIIQSGSWLKGVSPDDASKLSAAIYAQLGIKTGDVRALQKVPAPVLLSAAQIAKRRGDINGIRFGPVVDNVVLKRDPWFPNAPDSASRVPMMIGTTLEEAAFFSEAAILAEYPDDNSILDAVSELAVYSGLNRQDYEKLLPLFKKEFPELSGAKLAVRMATDGGFWRNAVKQLELKAGTKGTAVYAYEFDWEWPYLEGKWALHGGDLPFVFGHENMTPCWDMNDTLEARNLLYPQTVREHLARQTISAWSAFAWTGNPSTNELKWPAYTSDTRAVMKLNAVSKVVNDPRSTIRKAIV